MRIFEAAANNNNIQNIEYPNPTDYNTQEEYEQAIENYEKNIANNSNLTTETTTLSSTTLLSAGLKDYYKSNTGYENFRKYFEDLSPNIIQDCLNSFDSQADLEMQQTIAEALYGRGKATVNINELQGILKSKGITVSTEYVSAQYRIDEFAVGGEGYVTNGAITVMTFKDANGGKIKIADANGNAALETDELFMNEILGGITTDIGNMSTELVTTPNIIDTNNPLQEKINEMLKNIQIYNLTEIDTQQNNNNSNNQILELSDKEQLKIKEAYAYALEILTKNNSNTSKIELEELAENYVRIALNIPFNISLNDIIL